MIRDDSGSIYHSANALYYGFMGQPIFSFNSGATESAPSALSANPQFLGEIQQLGLNAILDASMGIT